MFILSHSLSFRAGLNQLYSASQKTLGTEQKLRQQLEQELELQKNARKEKEVHKLSTKTSPIFVVDLFVCLFV